MTDAKMQTILLSSIGLRDPWDMQSKDTSKYFGPFLSGFMRFKPNKIFVLLNDGNKENFDFVKEYLDVNGYLDNIELFELNTYIKKASDDFEIDKQFRKTLAPHLQVINNNKTYINLSPGTPQMSAAIKILVATNFLEGTIFNVDSPEFSTKSKRIDVKQDRESLKLKFTQFQPTENISEIYPRVIVKDGKLKIPFVDRIIRTISQELIKTFNYNQAYIILQQIQQKCKEDKVFLLPLLKVCSEIFLFNFSGDIVQDLESLIDNSKFNNHRIINYLTDLRNFLSNPSNNLKLCYFIVEAKLINNQSSEFSFYAGLYREKLLEYFINQPEIKIYYQAAVKEIRGRRTLIADDLKFKYPDLYEFMLDKLNKDSNIFKVKELKNMLFTATPMYQIFDYVKSLEPEKYSKQYNFFNNTLDLAELRNRSAHTFSYTNNDEIENSKILFQSHIKELAFGSESEQKNIFELINSELINILKYWSYT